MALGFLATSSPLLLLGSALPGIFWEVVLVLITGVFPVALAVVGAARRGRLGPLALPLALLLLLLCAGLAAMLALRGRVLEAPWPAGLPLAAAIQLGVVLLAPLPLVGFAFALAFDRFSLRPERLAELRRRFPERRPPEA